MYYKQVLRGKLVKVEADALGGHFAAPGACRPHAAVATTTGCYAAFVRTPQMGFFSVDLNERFLFMSRQCGCLPGLLDANAAHVRAPVLALSSYI